MVNNVFDKLTKSIGNSPSLSSSKSLGIVTNDEDKSKMNDNIMVEILKSVKLSNQSITSTKEALLPFKESNVIVKDLLTKIDNAEALTSDFIKTGKSLSPQEASTMLDLVGGVTDSINENLELQVGNESLKGILQRYKVQENKNTLLNFDLFNNLSDLSGKIGTSAKDFLVSNASAISSKGIGGDLAVTALGAVAPQLALVTKALDGVVDFGSIFDSTKGLIGGLFAKKDKSEDEVDVVDSTSDVDVVAKVTDEIVKSNEEIISDNKDIVHSIDEVRNEVQLLRSGLVMNEEDNSDIEEERFEENMKQLKKLEKATKDIDVKGGLTILGAGLLGGAMNLLKGAGSGFFGGKGGKGRAGGFGRVLGKGLGIAAGAGLVYGSTDVTEKRGQSFFGGGKGEGGLLKSRASDYAQGAAGGALLGAQLGGPLGALIGGFLGLATTLIMDKLPEIKKGLAKIGTAVKDFFVSGFNTVNEFFSSTIEKVSEILNDPIGAFKDLVIGAFDSIVEFFGFLGEKLSTVAKALGDPIGFIQGLISGDSEDNPDDAKEIIASESKKAEDVLASTSVKISKDKDAAVSSLLNSKAPLMSKRKITPSETSTSKALMEKKNYSMASSLEQDISNKENFENYKKVMNNSTNSSVVNTNNTSSPSPKENMSKGKTLRRSSLSDTIWSMDDVGLMLVTGGSI